SSTTFNQNQSCDEYYDSLSYPFQEERYGQDEEDRQWDSGGYYDNTTANVTPPAKTGKKLPIIPQNYKRRSSFASTGEENYRPSITTPLGRRKMPQIPTRRSTSRQSSFTDDSFKGPDYVSHRGASLPPTPTRSSSRIMPKVQTPAKAAFNSLPATPGRQLPKPNLNQRKGGRNGRLKRTSSAEYGETDTYDNYYLRAGAISAQNVYNEDYNYAYRSIDDNLPEEDNLVPVSVTSSSDIRTNTSVNVTSTYFSAHNDNSMYFNEPGSYYAKQLGSTSPLLQQQNTDSLESRDDDMKDSSFETVVSSVNSSNHYQQAKPTTFPEYSTAGETTSKAEADQPAKQLKNVPEVKPTPTATLNQNSVRNRGPLKSQESVDQQQALDNSYRYQHNQSLTYQQEQNGSVIPNQLTGYQKLLATEYQPEQNEYQQEHAANDRVAVTEQYNEYEEEPYLEAQESVESYVEEDVSNETHVSDYQKTAPIPATVGQSGESPPHDAYGDEDAVSLRRGSSQITVIDPYHPSLQHRASFTQAVNRRTSDAASVPSRKASDAYAGYDDTFSRKPSVVEASGIQRHGSVRHSPSAAVPTVTVQTEYGDDIPEEDQLQDDQKDLDQYEDEDQKEQRPKITAQQRWLWAYNKIIMQLNTNKNNSVCPKVGRYKRGLVAGRRL
ncbi:hypothetical protein GWI33_019071, partial [Rhynchophorus ferrugineus]